MIKHLKKKKRFLNRLHEIEEHGSQVSEKVVQELQDLVKKQQSRIQDLESTPSSSETTSELRDALTQMKSALSESTSDAINTQRLLDEQLVRLGNSLESAESKAAETALETSKVIARLESDLDSQRKRLESALERSSVQELKHTEAISSVRSHYEREMQLLQDQYRSLRERHQAERQAHVAQHDRLQELLRLRVADVEAERTRVTTLSREVQNLRKELATVKKLGVKERQSDVVSLSHLATSWKRENEVFTQARQSHMMEVSSLEKLLMAQQQHLLKQCAGVSASNLALRATIDATTPNISKKTSTFPPMVEVGNENEDEDEDDDDEKEMKPPPIVPRIKESISTSKEEDLNFLDEIPPVFAEALRERGDITPPRAHSPPSLGSPHDPILDAHVMAVSTPAENSSSSSSSSSSKKKKKHRGHHHHNHHKKHHHRGHRHGK